MIRFKLVVNEHDPDMVLVYRLNDQKQDKIDWCGGAMHIDNFFSADPASNISETLRAEGQITIEVY